MSSSSCSGTRGGRCSSSRPPSATAGTRRAYHAAKLTLRRPHRFPLALCFSGVYFNNPLDYVPGLDGSPTGALESTLAFAETLSAQGIRHELDVWGEDAPHDWPAWRAQLAKHLPRFV